MNRKFNSLTTLNIYDIVDINSNGYIIPASGKSIGFVNERISNNEYSVSLNNDIIRGKFDGVVGFGSGLVVDDGVFKPTTSNFTHVCVNFDSEFCDCVLVSYPPGGGGGGGGTNNYEDLINKPSVNNVELEGNKDFTGEDFAINSSSANSIDQEMEKTHKTLNVGDTLHNNTNFMWQPTGDSFKYTGATKVLPNNYDPTNDAQAEEHALITDIKDMVQPYTPYRAELNTIEYSFGMNVTGTDGFIYRYISNTPSQLTDIAELEDVTKWESISSVLVPADQLTFEKGVYANNNVVSLIPANLEADTSYTITLLNNDVVYKPNTILQQHLATNGTMFYGDTEAEYTANNPSSAGEIQIGQSNTEWVSAPIREDRELRVGTLINFTYMVRDNESGFEAIDISIEYQGRIIAHSNYAFDIPNTSQKNGNVLILNDDISFQKDTTFKLIISKRDGNGFFIQTSQPWSTVENGVTVHNRATVFTFSNI